MSTRVFRATVLAAVLLAAGPPALLSADTGEISGKVLEPNGEPSPFAELTFLEPATGAHRETVAGFDGKYLAAGLSAGTWRVVANSKQSRSAIRATTEIHAGEKVDLPLNLFAVWESVDAKDLPGMPLYGGNY